MPMPSHIIFEDVLGTNYTPTDEEVLTIKNLISGPLLHIAMLDEEISAAEKRLHHLRQSRTAMLAEIEPYLQLISPARRLPTDLIREIFVHCLPEDRNPTMSIGEAPVLLTRISSHWRTIAFTTPRLWAALHIATPTDYSGMTGWYDSQSGNRIPVSQVLDARLAASTEWIKKSGTLPLSFSLEGNGHAPDEYIKMFLQRILPYRTRWKRIDLYCDPSSLFDIHDLPPSEVPLLQSMFLVINHGGALTSPHWNDMSIFRAPTIRQLKLTGTRMVMVAEIYKFPFTWSQLTDLDVQGEAWGSSIFASLDELVSILAKCTNLVSLHLRTITVPVDNALQQATQFPTISLPHLESLSIFDEDGRSSALLYNSIDAPKVRKLIYDASKRFSVSTICPLTPLLESIGSSLKELVVMYAVLQGQEAVSHVWFSARH